MFKRIAWVCLIIFILAIGNYLLRSIDILLHTSHGLSLIPALTTPLGSISSGGLSAIDFSFFDKNAKGWNYITQGYGNTPYSYLYINHWHDGIDIAARYGAPIYSPTDGIVVATGNQDNYCPGDAFGKYIAVEDDTHHVVLWFAHLNTIFAKPLDTVHHGDLLGTIGNSGLETGPHLHFSIFQSEGFAMNPAHGCGPYPNGKDLNPLSYIGSVYQ